MGYTNGDANAKILNPSLTKPSFFKWKKPQSSDSNGTHSNKEILKKELPTEDKIQLSEEAQISNFLEDSSSEDESSSEEPPNDASQNLHNINTPEKHNPDVLKQESLIPEQLSGHSEQEDNSSEEPSNDEPSNIETEEDNEIPPKKASLSPKQSSDDSERDSKEQVEKRVRFNVEDKPTPLPEKSSFSRSKIQRKSQNFSKLNWQSFYDDKWQPHKMGGGISSMFNFKVEAEPEKSSSEKASQSEPENISVEKTLENDENKGTVAREDSSSEDESEDFSKISFKREEPKEKIQNDFQSSKSTLLRSWAKLTKQKGS